MPTGEYALMPDMHTGGPILVERFSCAPGPVGWRYAATVAEEATGVVRGRVDVTVDARWRQARVELRAGAWLLRGGVAGRELLWVRGGADGAGATEHAEVAAAFTGTSPAFLVTSARMLGLVAGESASVELVAITGDALATRTVRQRWSYVEGTEHEADVGPLRVARFAVADLDTGTVGDVYLAGDVVLAAPGIELRSLESPPNLSDQAGAW